MSKNETSFSKTEKARIETGDSIMHLFLNTNEKELKVLRKTAKALNPDLFIKDDYRLLKKKMLSTVLDPKQPGVGIAAPQVGVSRKLVAVQRFDKAGNPFEFYPNIEILEKSQSTQVGPEGCLSVPNRRAMVKRAANIRIRYQSEATGAWIEESVSGFTAVIFQHEVDHLYGILYIDKMVKEIPEDKL